MSEKAIFKTDRNIIKVNLAIHRNIESKSNFSIAASKQEQQENAKSITPDEDIFKNAFIQQTNLETSSTFSKNKALICGEISLLYLVNKCG